MKNPEGMKESVKRNDKLSFPQNGAPRKINNPEGMK
jgi:hypothetical protein